MTPDECDAMFRDVIAYRNITEVGRRHGLSRTTVRCRVERGWSRFMALCRDANVSAADVLPAKRFGRRPAKPKPPLCPRCAIRLGADGRPEVPCPLDGCEYGTERPPAYERSLAGYTLGEFR